MQVHVHTKFCFLCVLTFLFQQCNHCHGDQSGGHHHGNHSDLQISEAPYVRAAAGSPDSKSPEGGALEEEQRFYIQELFRRYGQRDRLDFQGFESLLFSLGLGGVKVVDVDHEHLGHDHVAHLDLLDLQEGLHSHSSTSKGHHHEHDHPHQHPRSIHPSTERGPTTCSHTPAVSPAADAPAKYDHDPYHGHTHHHSEEEDSNHKHSDDQVQDAHDDHIHDKGDQQVQVNHKDVSSQPKNHNHSDHSGDHKHHTHQVPVHTDTTPFYPKQIPSANLEPSQVHQSSPAPTKRPKRLRTKARGQQVPNKSLSPDTAPSDDHKHEHSHDHHEKHAHSHSHKDKREAPGAPGTPSPPMLSGHLGSLSHQHEEVGLFKIYINSCWYTRTHENFSSSFQHFEGMLNFL